MPLAVITATQLRYITQRANHKHSEIDVHKDENDAI